MWATGLFYLPLLRDHYDDDDDDQQRSRSVLLFHTRRPRTTHWRTGGDSAAPCLGDCGCSAAPPNVLLRQSLWTVVDVVFHSSGGERRHSHSESHPPSSWWYAQRYFSGGERGAEFKARHTRRRGAPRVSGSSSYFPQQTWVECSCRSIARYKLYAISRPYHPLFEKFEHYVEISLSSRTGERKRVRERKVERKRSSKLRHAIIQLRLNMQTTRQSWIKNVKIIY